MTTVNNQLQAKVEELEHANNNITNLLASTDIAVVFLDTSLRVVRFTPPAAKLLSLLPSDEGRPYRDLAPKFDDTTLLEECQRVLRSHAPAEKEVWSDVSVQSETTPGGRKSSPRCYLRNIRPYYTTEHGIEGVVVTLIDMTDRIAGEAEMPASPPCCAIRTTPCWCSISIGAITAWNRGAEQTYGYSEADALRMNLSDIVPEEHRAESLAELRLIEGDQAKSFETRRKTKDGRILNVWLSGTRLIDESGNRFAIATTERDITERKQHLLALERLNNTLEDEIATRDEGPAYEREPPAPIVDRAADAIITVGEHGRIDSFNRAAEVMFGSPAERMIGQHIKRLMAQPYRDEQDNNSADYLRTDRISHRGPVREMVGQRGDGTTFPIELVVGDLSDGDERRLTVLIRDMSERNELQKEILQVAEQEQPRIGQDLHDSTQQELSGLGMIAENLYESLKAQEAAPQAAIAARGFRREWAEALENVPPLVAQDWFLRRSAHGLRMALAELAPNIGIAGRRLPIRMRRHDRGAGSIRRNPSLSDRARGDHQCAKTRGRQAYLGLVGEAARVVSIESDRRRTRDSAPSEDGKGIGLKVMFYRAGMIGGSMHVERLQDGGTEVSCTFPAV